MTLKCSAPASVSSEGRSQDTQLASEFKRNDTLQTITSSCEKKIKKIQLRNLQSKAVPLPPCTRQGEKKYSSYSFLTSALDGVSGQRHAAAFYLREWIPGIHLIGRWLDIIAGLDTEARGKILCLCRESNTGHPVVQSIDSQSYPSFKASIVFVNLLKSA